MLQYYVDAMPADVPTEASVAITKMAQHIAHVLKGTRAQAVGMIGEKVT